MRALKVLVVVMGVLLIGGMIVLVGTIASRMGRPAAEAPRPGFGDVAIDLPAGATLTARDVVGDRLVLTVALPGGGHRLLVFDPRSGTVLGSLELRSAQ